jgi:hypothetical protein
MPDLNQIKQGEQGRATGAGGSPRVSPVYGNRLIRRLFSRGQPRGEPAMTVLSRLDVRPMKKYTSALG